MSATNLRSGVKESQDIRMLRMVAARYATVQKMEN